MIGRKVFEMGSGENNISRGHYGSQYFLAFRRTFLVIESCKLCTLYLQYLENWFSLSVKAKKLHEYNQLNDIS